MIQRLRHSLVAVSAYAGEKVDAKPLLVVQHQNQNGPSVHVHRLMPSALVKVVPRD